MDLITTRKLLVQHIHRQSFKKAAKKYLTGQMIDIGCGRKPYKELVAPHVTKHVGIDQETTPHDKLNIDLYGTAYKLPVKDSSFDSAICTAVLEHLEEPEKALRECHRVLKPGGVAIYSVPFIWHLHEEPRDFYRFTKHGLKYLFEKVGFEIVEIKALSGFWITFGQLSVYYLERFNRGPIRWLKVASVLGLLIQGFTFILEKLDKAEAWTWMYLVVATKDESRRS